MTDQDGTAGQEQKVTANDLSTPESAVQSFMQDLQAENLPLLVATLDNIPDQEATVKVMTSYLKARTNDGARIASWRITGQRQDGGNDVFVVQYKTKAGTTGKRDVPVYASDADDNLERPYLVDDDALPKLGGLPYALQRKLGADDTNLTSNGQSSVLLAGNTPIKYGEFTQYSYVLPGTYKLKTTLFLIDNDDESADPKILKKPTYVGTQVVQLSGPPSLDSGS